MKPRFRPSRDLSRYLSPRKLVYEWINERIDESDSKAAFTAIGLIWLIPILLIGAAFVFCILFLIVINAPPGAIFRTLAPLIFVAGLLVALGIFWFTARQVTGSATQDRQASSPAEDKEEITDPRLWQKTPFETRQQKLRDYRFGSRPQAATATGHAPAAAAAPTAKPCHPAIATYINDCRKAGFVDDAIVFSLQTAGWPMVDITVALVAIPQ